MKCVENPTHVATSYIHQIHIFIQCIINLCRKRSTHKNTGNFAVSGNMAYGEVKSGMISMGEYENPNKIKPSDQTTAVAASIYENIGTSKQPCDNGAC